MRDDKVRPEIEGNEHRSRRRRSAGRSGEKDQIGNGNDQHPAQQDQNVAVSEPRRRIIAGFSAPFHAPTHIPIAVTLSVDSAHIVPRNRNPLTRAASWTSPESAASTCHSPRQQTARPLSSLEITTTVTQLPPRRKYNEMRRESRSTPHLRSNFFATYRGARKENSNLMTIAARALVIGKTQGTDRLFRLPSSRSQLSLYFTSRVICGLGPATILSSLKISGAGRYPHGPHLP